MTMTVYLDDYRFPVMDDDRRLVHWSWLTSDDPSLNELHEFAASIDLPEAWYRSHSPDDKYQPHYEVPDEHRDAAHAAGAVPIPWHHTKAVIDHALQQSLQHTADPAEPNRHTLDDQDRHP